MKSEIDKKKNSASIENARKLKKTSAYDNENKNRTKIKIN